jgi:hypothetical protein
MHLQKQVLELTRFTGLHCGAWCDLHSCTYKEQHRVTKGETNDAATITIITRCHNTNSTKYITQLNIKYTKQMHNSPTHLQQDTN